MKKFFSFLLVAIALISLMGCSNLTEAHNSQIYEGRNLVIGVVGDAPEVKEKNIQFERIAFTDFTNLDKMNTYDAIFITKENLDEASQPQFSAVYKNSHIPFVFIESQKSAMPFLIEDLSYEDASVVGKLDFATLYYNDFSIDSGESDYTETFGLYNDEVTEDHIKETFSLIFSSIEKFSNK